MNQKAQAHFGFNVIHIIVRMFLLITVVLSFMMLVRHYYITNIDVHETEGNVLLNRIMYSPNCISYMDQEISRRYPGVIDPDNFKTSNLDECIYFGRNNDKAAANLTLQIIGEDDSQSVLFNEEGYGILRPRAEIEGPGGTDLFKGKRYVLVDDGDLVPAILTVELVLSR